MGKLHKKKQTSEIVIYNLDLNELHLFYLPFQLLLEQLWRAIVWDAIVLGINKKGAKLSGAIRGKTFVRGSLSRGNFPGENCLRVIISGQLFCKATVWAPTVQGLIIWGGGDYRGGNFLGDSYPGAIILGANFPEGNYRGGNCPKQDNYPVGNCPVLQVIHN